MASPQSLSDDRAAQLGRRGRSTVGVGHDRAPSGNGAPWRASRRLESTSDNVGTVRANLRFQRGPEEVADVLETGVEHLVREWVSIKEPVAGTARR